jgi:EAL domain-containing protein (putative c-di-GMP-specific phosphodiesterase class I)
MCVSAAPGRLAISTPPSPRIVFATVSGQAGRMTTSSSADKVNLRRQDDNERFVAFAFSAAEMLVETEVAGVVNFAAGAFRTHFGRVADAFCNSNVRDMVAFVDHEKIDEALQQLVERGRVCPFVIRLANTDRTPLALSGIVLPSAGRPARYCFSFARLPAAAPSIVRAGAGKVLTGAAAAALVSGGGELNLIEILSDSRLALSSSPALCAVLQSLAPGATATEISPGRFGLLTQAGQALAPAKLAEDLAANLRADGIEAAVANCRLDLTAEGLSSQQAMTTMRHALAVFARHGPTGFTEAGFDGGIASYMKLAAMRARVLRAAIDESRFSLVYQPIVALRDRRFHHVEALIRPLPIPGIALPGPQDFIILVESLGLAEALDLAVCDMACRAASRARRMVAFNISGQSLQSALFREQLSERLKQSPARKAGLLMVELTETSEIEDVAEAVATAQALRTLGVSFCIDDFGAGSTDVRQLRALSPDIVKLDGSYVPGVAEEGRERAFLAGMVEIARAAGARTVAERIETEAEAEALREIGVELGQGWLFGRPGQLGSAPASRGAAPASLAVSGRV